MVNQLTEAAIGACITVHRALGPGLLESVYRKCLAYELREQGFQVAEEFPVPVVYKGVRLDCGYRIDLLMEGSVAMELKCADRLAPIHQAQILTYLRLLNLEVGLLVNFKQAVLIDGLKRIVNGYKG
jgi:GxxExxY protein